MAAQIIVTQDQGDFIDHWELAQEQGFRVIEGVLDLYVVPEDGETYIICSLSHQLCMEAEIAERLDTWVKMPRLASYNTVTVAVNDGSRGSGAPSRPSAIVALNHARDLRSKTRENDHRNHRVRWSGFMGFCFDCRTYGYPSDPGFFFPTPSSATNEDAGPSARGSAS